LAGGDLGLLVIAEQWGQPFSRTMWWTPDVRTWQEIDGHPALAGGWASAAVSSDAVVVAPHSGFETGEPVLYVAIA
jgi:hypothetical protein